MKTADQLSRLTNAAIVKERTAALAVCSRLSDEMIAAGRGHERLSETLAKTDPLSLRMREAHAYASDVCMEASLRTGWSASSHDCELMVSPRFRRVKEAV